MKMHIGLDLLTLRWTQTGMHTYLRNLYRELTRLVEPSRLTPFLFGHPDADEPEHVANLGTDLLDPIQYVWDRPPLRLLSDRFARAPWWVRLIDRTVVMRCWRAHATRREKAPLQPLPNAPDLFHHIAFAVYPLHRVNVVTVPDLGVLGEPNAHSDELKNLLEEGLPLAKWSDLVLTYSEHTRRDIASRLNLPLDRIRVTPLAAHEQFRPLATAQTAAIKAKYELADRPYVIAVGMLEARKNLVRLLEAFAILKRAEPALSHRLVLVGVKAWGADNVFGAIRRLGLTGEVRWLDFAPFEELPGLLCGADLLVHPSLYEGFGLPPLEAMACGTPVVVSETTSLPEVVGEAGLLANPYRPESFTDAMRRVLTDPSLAQQLRQRGLQQARRFTWERTARLTLAAYQEANRLAQEQPLPRPAGGVRADRARAFWRPWVIDRVIRRASARLSEEMRAENNTAKEVKSAECVGRP